MCGIAGFLAPQALSGTALGVARAMADRMRHRGPDGGDGGRGGSIYAIADVNINTLIDYRYARIHRAKNGEKGQGSDCYGRGADDIVLRFPVGTVISDAETGSGVGSGAGDTLRGAPGFAFLGGLGFVSAGAIRLKRIGIDPLLLSPLSENRLDIREKGGFQAFFGVDDVLAALSIGQLSAIDQAGF